MEQSAARVQDHLAVADLVLLACSSDRDHAGTAAVGHRPGEKSNHETGKMNW